jgi:hypothetical protein
MFPARIVQNPSCVPSHLSACFSSGCRHDVPVQYTHNPKGLYPTSPVLDLSKSAACRRLVFDSDVMKFCRGALHERYDHGTFHVKPQFSCDSTVLGCLRLIKRR